MVQGEGRAAAPQSPLLHLSNGKGTKKNNAIQIFGQKSSENPLRKPYNELYINDLQLSYSRLISL